MILIVATSAYSNVSAIFGYGNISSNTVSSSMVQETINRAGYKVNKDLGADTSGDDYVDFQSSDSAGLSYVPTNTLAMIVRAHLNLTHAYTLILDNCPDLDAYTEIDGKLVNYRQDIKNEAKIKYYMDEYNRIIEFLMQTDTPDDYFGKRRNTHRMMIFAEPSQVPEPDGNPL